MSLINQVLTQLERRGVHVEQEQDMVRAVPLPRSGGWRQVILLLLLASLAAWWWLGSGTAVNGAKPPVQQVAASVAPRLSADAAKEEGIASHSSVAATSSVSAIAPVSAVAAVAVPSAAPSLPMPEPQPAPKPVALPKPAVNSPPNVAASAPVPRNVASATQAKPAGKPREAVVAQPAKRAPKPAASPDSRHLPPAPSEADGMPMKQVSSAQLAETEFRKGTEAMKQGRSSEAIASYQAALQLDGTHDGARQALVVLLLEDKRGSDAERLLQERLENRPEHTGFAMLLARLQVERGATGEALVTLERSLAHAETRADYLAFLAALQQRNSLHADAAAHYQAALKLQPGNGTWLMGYGISLQALRRTEEAKAAYRQALESKNLSPDLKVFVQRKLNGL